jgi:predicted ATPase
MATDMNVTIEEQCFLCGPWREIITRTVEAMSSVQEAVKIEHEHLKLKNHHYYKLLPGNGW